MTMTWSPVSRKGVYCGLFLPISTRATSVARRPTVWPSASTMYHLRFSASPSPLGKYVDIRISLSILSVYNANEQNTKRPFGCQAATAEGTRHSHGRLSSHLDLRAFVGLTAA